MKNRIKQYLLAASMCVGLTACKGGETMRVKVRSV